MSRFALFNLIMGLCGLVFAAALVCGVAGTWVGGLHGLVAPLLSAAFALGVIAMAVSLVPQRGLRPPE